MANNGRRKRSDLKPERNGDGAFTLQTRMLRARAVLAPGRSARVLGAACLYVLTCAALLYPMLLGIPLGPGDASTKDVNENVTFSFVDETATNDARHKAENAVEKIYRINPAKVRGDINYVFDLILDVHDLPGESARVADAKEELESILSQDTVVQLFTMDRQQVALLKGKSNTFVKYIIPENNKMDESSLNGLDKEIERRFQQEAEAPREQMAMLSAVIKKFVRANSFPDEEEIARRRNAASAAVPQVSRTFTRPVSVVHKGEVISQQQYQRLKQINSVPRRIPWTRVSGCALLIFFIFGALAAYLKNFLPRIYRNEKKMLIFYSLLLFAAFWALLVQQMVANISWFSPSALGISTGVLAILTCIILEPALALIATPLVALYITVTLQFDMGVFLVALVSGLVGCFATVRRQDLDSIMKAGLAIAVSSMAAIAIVNLLNFTDYSRAALDIFVFGSVNGFITAVGAAGVLPLFERMFNITTPHRLLDLSNPEQPLLKDMLINAPGTYHHSIFVGNLAESAAKLVGADALLVRIACYYHDVGKLKRPYFFVENQLTGASLLSDLSPTLGSLVISSHVKDGVEMLREHGVPEDIVRIAADHHGTCLISFFYQQARAQAKSPDDVREDRFRYPGPKPGSLESAIVMLADGCEASVRSLKEHTPHSIENQVNAIVKGRIVDGQFDECDITLSQLDAIRKAFIRILVGIYHARMEYPELEEEMKRKAEADGGLHAAAHGARNGRETSGRS